MLIAAWTAFLFLMLFLLGSVVGSFLNVCIVRLPQGRSLIRPGSHCEHCRKPIRMEDNLPLVSYWLLRGRCRACGAPFSIRYFWVELLTGMELDAEGAIHDLTPDALQERRQRLRQLGGPPDASKL